MKKAFLLLSTVCTIYVLPGTIVSAETPAVVTDAMSAASQSTQVTASKTASKTPWKSNSVPQKAVGLLVGAVVGTPASLVRRTVAEEKAGVQGIIGDSNNKLAKVSAGTFWLPFSLVLGALECPAFGPGNSLRNVNKPLSKEQMGLGDHLTSIFENTSTTKN